MAGIKQLPRMPQTGIPKLDRHLQATLDTLNPILRTISGVGSRQLLNSFRVTVPTDWITPTYQGTWSTVSGAANPPARYKMNAVGQVMVDGYVTGGASGSVIVNLGIGYRPAYNESFATTANDAFGKFYIAQNGDVTHQIGGTTNVSIACTFYADATDNAPVIPSCWPMDIPHSLPSSPIAVLVASCVDQSNPGVPSAVNAFPLQWVTTPGVPNSIRVLNIPGLLPTRTYSIQLLAMA